MKTSNILLSVLGSAFVGALLGVLFAPDKGAKTRKELSKKGDEYAGMAKKEYDELIKKMNKQYDNLKSQSDELVNKGKSKAEELRDELKKVVS
ncbi:MAG: YtxH domain-containing protein [Balneolaceae bacterium]|jgi:gas vesicle protein|nr:MAG: YtxH domain-containing protein [Balneolaceae bacterium]